MPTPPRTVLVARARWWIRRRRVVPLLALATVALGSGVAVAGALDGAERAAASWGPRLPTVVARHDLAPGDELGADDVALDDRPPAARPAGATDNGAAVVGRTVTAPVLAGEAVVDTRLAPAGLSGPAARVGPGRRAVTVPAPRGAATPVRVGDRVDLVTVTDGAIVARAATVVDTGDEGALTVAVARDEVAAVARALGAGEVLPALVGARA